jgi:hypothetical protein
MFMLQAPSPALQTTTALPSPQFSDSEALLDSVSTRIALDGTVYTYVKRRNGRRKFLWTFRMSRNKGLELRAFLQSYFASPIRITDHNGRVFVGYFTSNPFEFETTGRAAPAIPPWPRGETQTIQLEFEGVEQ